MTRKEEVQIIIKDKARDIEQFSQLMQNKPKQSDLKTYREKLEQAIQYIDELEKLSK
jgi:soluble cytochrome b562